MQNVGSAPSRGRDRAGGRCRLRRISSTSRPVGRRTTIAELDRRRRRVAARATLVPDASATRIRCTTAGRARPPQPHAPLAAASRTAIDPRICLTVEAVQDGVRRAGSPIPCGIDVAEIDPRPRHGGLEGGRHQPSSSTDSRLVQAVEQSLADLAALRIVDAAQPDRVLVAAGAPWFMTLFGRDSLLTAWMMLPFDPSLARGVLRTLAELQGTRLDPEADEEPGKVLHELRRRGTGGPFTDRRALLRLDRLDAAVRGPRRRGVAMGRPDPPTTSSALGPAVDAALDWLVGKLDTRDFVAYERQRPTGLANQGWKDSWDAIAFADGTLAETPVALVEVQGYAYAALLGAADLASPMRLRHRPDELRDARRSAPRAVQRPVLGPAGLLRARTGR